MSKILGTNSILPRILKNEILYKTTEFEMTLNKIPH